MRPKTLALLLSAIVLVTAACGGGDDGGGSEGGGAVAIESPEAGAEVSVPFTLELSSSETIGPTDSGEHHFHVYFDDNEDDYEVVESLTFEVTSLDAGDHTIYVSLRNADHSAAGAEEEIEVTVAGGVGGTEKDEDKNGSGYDY